MTAQISNETFYEKFYKLEEKEAQLKREILALTDQRHKLTAQWVKEWDAGSSKYETNADISLAMRVLGSNFRNGMVSHACKGSEFRNFYKSLEKGKVYLERTYHGAAKDPSFVIVHVPSVSGAWIMCEPGTQDPNLLIVNAVRGAGSNLKRMLTTGAQGPDYWYVEVDEIEPCEDTCRAM